MTITKKKTEKEEPKFLRVGFEPG